MSPIATFGGVVALLAAGLLFMRGLASVAVPLAMLGSWLLWGTTSGPWLGGGRKTPGQTSRVETEHLEMELDHDTGEMRGRVLKGLFAGRDIESLSAADMALLWQDCRHTDPPSAQLIEAYVMLRLNRPDQARRTLQSYLMRTPAR